MIKVFVFLVNVKPKVFMQHHIPHSSLKSELTSHFNLLSLRFILVHSIVSLISEYLSIMLKNNSQNQYNKLYKSYTVISKYTIKVSLFITHCFILQNVMDADQFRQLLTALFDKIDPHREEFNCYLERIGNQVLHNEKHRRSSSNCTTIVYQYWFTIIIKQHYFFGKYQREHQIVASANMNRVFQSILFIVKLGKGN